MNEMKPEDVMRALEHCATNMRCYECPYVVVKGGKCHSNMVSDVLALLKKYQAENAEKDAEIKRLTTDLQAMRSAANSLKMHLEALQDEFFDYQADVQTDIAYARAEAIDEFEMMLRKDIILNGAFGFEYTSQRDEALESISKIAKELKGD